jgi:hypothetical protein
MSRRRMTFGRTTRDEPIKKATRRGRGPGRTRQSRVDDMRTVQDARKPRGVTSPIKDATKTTAPPTTAPRSPKVDVTKPVNNQKPPASGLANVTGTEQGKTSGVRRNVGTGREEKANVTREQLQKTGLSLRDYLNFMDKNDRRPRSKADSTEAKAITAAFKAKKAKKPVKKAMRGGMMKSKMKAKGMKAGGKMKAKGYMAGGKMKAKGMAGGGKMKAKGMAVGGLKEAPEGNKGLKKLPKEVRNKMGFMAKGGMMKSKGYAKGGMKSKGYAAGGMKSKMATKKKPTKQKVRGAGIARKGVRPAKMR